MAIANGVYYQFQAEAKVVSKFATNLNGEPTLFYVTQTPAALRMRAYSNPEAKNLAFGEFKWCSGFNDNDTIYVYYLTKSRSIRLILVDRFLSTTYRTYTVNTGSQRINQFSVMKAGNFYYLAAATNEGEILFISSSYLFDKDVEFKLLIFNDTTFTYSNPSMSYEQVDLVNGKLNKLVIGTEVDSTNVHNVAFYPVVLDV